MNKTTESTLPNISSAQTELTKPDNNDPKDNSHFKKDEDPNQYCIGGYHPVNIGDVFNDRYEVLRKLGFGGFSTVWQCRDLISSDAIAMKILKSKAEWSAKNEIKCYTIVSDNKLFVKLLEHFEVRGVNGVHQCLISELLGGNLCDLIRKAKGGIPIQNVKIIAKQVLEGLDYLHTKCKIVHCDIKMDNILFCIEDQLKVKIADYGSVRSANLHPDKNEQIQPTAEYRSPEVILAYDFGPSIDIWSTACVLFKLATAKRLFHPVSLVHHLALMMQLLGKFPERMMLKGNRGMKFFRSQSMLKYKDLKPDNLYRRLRRRSRLDENSANGFMDFLLTMLEYDPDRRASAGQCLGHYWLN